MKTEVGPISPLNLYTLNSRYNGVNNMQSIRQILTLSIFLSLTYSGFALGDEKKNTRSQYIENWKDVAIENMEKFGIPASITLAQGILESGDGNSSLARDANNHFGIKCHGWKGKKVYKDDDAKNECFRKYKSAADSYEDHSQFLQKKRYAFLFNLGPTDYKAWAKGLKKAGYATNPKYPKLLISLIEKNKLYKYDNEVQEMAAKTKKVKHKKLAVKKPASESRDVITFETAQRKVTIHSNKIRYTLAKKGDNVKSIAAELDMGEWQLKKYNDLDGRSAFKEDEIVFLQPKRNKASKADYHIVEYGESLWDLSQEYGVKMKKLQDYNGIAKGDKLLIGMKFWLKRPPRG